MTPLRVETFEQFNEIIIHVVTAVLWLDDVNVLTQ